MTSKVNSGQVNFKSWGRTRSPKNILSQHRAGIDASGTGKTLTVGGTATVTCVTENQRFLHVVCSGVTGRLRQL